MNTPDETARACELVGGPFDGQVVDGRAAMHFTVGVGPRLKPIFPGVADVFEKPLHLYTRAPRPSRNDPAIGVFEYAGSQFAYRQGSGS